MEIFKKNRATIENIMADTLRAIQSRYAQSNQMFTVASAWGQILYVLQNLSQFILFFIEDSITELNINEASRESSIYGLAALAGHNATRATSARGTVELVWNGKDTSEVGGGAILIPNKASMVFVNGGSKYFLNISQDNIRLNLNKTSKITAQIVQGILRTATFTGDGTKLQSFSVSERSTSSIENFEVTVKVNGEVWKVYSSLYDIPYNTKGVIIKTGISPGIDIFFGNGRMGMVPPEGSIITVDYVETLGYSGNINSTDPGLIKMEFESEGSDVFGYSVDLNDFISINVTVPPQLGANQESIAVTRLIAPKTSRAYVLANPDSYITFFEKYGTFSIIEAFSTFDDQYLDDDNVVYVLLVPDVTLKMKSNENYFNLKKSDFVLSEYQKTRALEVIEESGQKIVTTVVNIIDPKISRYVVNVVISVFEGYDPETIKNTIVDLFSDYFLTIRRRDKIPRSDLIALIEGIPGVDSVMVFFMSEKNENYQRSVASLASTDPRRKILQGLDQFGDIVMEKDEVVIISGGWTDSNDVYYDTGADLNKLSSVNIDVSSMVPVTYNTQVNMINKSNIKSNNVNTNS